MKQKIRTRLKALLKENFLILQTNLQLQMLFFSLIKSNSNKTIDEKLNNWPKV